MKRSTMALVSFHMLGAIIALFFFITPTSAQTLTKPIYISPRPGAKFVSPGTTIAIRFKEKINAVTFNRFRFDVTGTKSGIRRGSIILAQDKQTIIFNPAQQFAVGEDVRVVINYSNEPSLGRIPEYPLSFRFTIASNLISSSPEDNILSPQEKQLFERRSISPPAKLAPKYMNIPSDMPVLTVTVPASGTAPGYVFIAPFMFFGPQSSYLLILDDLGQPIYYQKQAGLVTDFKVQPNGLLTYWAGGQYYAMDSTYNVVDNFHAGNGYPTTDLHELLLTNDGHALLMIYDSQTVDMSEIVPGGSPTATVTGLIVQELDISKTVSFEWRSWDHFLITDTLEPLTNNRLDYVHGNAIEIDNDGNLMISSRHMSEITKINRQTGDIIWRLGGKNNQFTFVNDSPPYFQYQHDIRRFPNGDISVFDNRNYLMPQYSRAAEYQIDEVGKVVTLTWQYTNTPPIYAPAMGDARRLSNGNTIIGWGIVPQLDEVRPDGTKAFEMIYAAPNVSYRAFRSIWHGYPTTAPLLTWTRDLSGTKLYFSWNGATEIASYKIYGGYTPAPTSLLTTVPRSGFETLYAVPQELTDCIYRVLPVDGMGNGTQYSNDVNVCNKFYFPLIGR